VIHSNVSEPLQPGGLLLSWTEPRSSSPCWEFELNGRGAYPDGTPVVAEDLASSWEKALNDPFAEHQWLLDPVTGRSEPAGERAPAAEWLRPRGQVLRICPRTPTPDLPARLAHPALWLRRVAQHTGLSYGPGPFRAEPDGTLTPNPGFEGDGPYVDDVEPLQVEGNPALLLRLGDAHAAVVFGREANALIADASDPLEVERLPSWDRTYFLWLDPAKRWINDPVFRRWISRAIDRDEMIDYLFDGHGERAFSLSRGGSVVPVYEPLQPDRPLSPMSVPRLELLYDEDDPYAETVAQRVRAVLETHDVELSVTARSRGAIRQALSEKNVEMALLAHRPALEDPLLATLGSVWWLGDGAGEALERLKAASELKGPADRASKAWEAEELLLEDARVIPLIRLHAWWVRHTQLSGVAPGPDGVLRFEEVWWRP
jgi:ABC-type transport system substrate-binding protein